MFRSALGKRELIPEILPEPPKLHAEIALELQLISHSPKAPTQLPALQPTLFVVQPFVIHQTSHPVEGSEQPFSLSLSLLPCTTSTPAARAIDERRLREALLLTPTPAQQQCSLTSNRSPMN